MNRIHVNLVDMIKRSKASKELGSTYIGFIEGKNTLCIMGDCIYFNGIKLNYYLSPSEKQYVLDAVAYKIQEYVDVCIGVKA